MEKDKLNGIVKFIKQMYNPSDVQISDEDGRQSIILTFDTIPEEYGKSNFMYRENPQDNLHKDANEMYKARGLQKDIIEKVSSYFQLTPSKDRYIDDVGIYVKNMNNKMLKRDTKIEKQDLDDLYYLVIDLLESGKSPQQINNMVSRAIKTIKK